MKKTKILCALTALTMFTSMLASCGDTTNSNSDKETVTTPVTVESSTAEVSSPTETNEDSSSVADSSEYETTTTKTSLDDSSDSEKTETTTKTVTDNSDKETKETTSAKQTTAQPKATTTTKAVAATTTVRATQSTAKPVVTTRATTKTTAKQTTRVTTKTTPQTSSSFTIPSNATTLQKALYEIFMRHNVAANAKIAQQEFIKYGKQKMPNYKTSAYLHPMIDKNGKYSDVYNSNYEYADGVEFYTVHQLQSENGLTASAAWRCALFEESQIKRDIDNHAYNLKGFSYPEEVLWYVTIGIRGNDVDIVVLHGFTFDWKY